jgi:hypothetical protein
VNAVMNLRVLVPRIYLAIFKFHAKAYVTVTGGDVMYRIILKV